MSLRWPKLPSDQCLPPCPSEKKGSALSLLLSEHGNSATAPTGDGCSAVPTECRNPEHTQATDSGRSGSGISTFGSSIRRAARRRLSTQLKLKRQSVHQWLEVSVTRVKSIGKSAHSTTSSSASSPPPPSPRSLRSPGRRLARRHRSKGSQQGAARERTSRGTSISRFASVSLFWMQQIKGRVGGGLSCRHAAGTDGGGSASCASIGAGNRLCDVPRAEIDALLDLFDALGGAHWRNSEGWGGDMLGAAHEQQLLPSPAKSLRAGAQLPFGVVVSEGHVATLDLKNNNLRGTLPASIGALSGLVTLYLQYNAIEGELPRSIGHLKQLQHLYANNNALTGPIPPELGACRRLEFLWLYSNRLTGRIPRELLQLESLSSLSLSGNEIVQPDEKQVRYDRKVKKYEKGGKKI